MNLSLDPSEDSELDDATRRLRAEGWASHVTARRLLSEWEALVTKVEQGYEATIDDYTNDLTARDGVELILGWVSQPLRARLKPIVSELDERFKSATGDDDGAAVGRYFRVDGTSGWWWRRRPVAGELSRYLDGSSA